MNDLVDRARDYAFHAHGRIDHRRKYTQKPYTTHLEAVAGLVASIIDDQEMIAAAWLHDTVEDTPATLEDIEAGFGPGVAELVEELTDISKPGDGNRSVRKSLDRQHLAQASVRAKTVKLADLIDNCKDISRNDPRFARIYLAEMGALLDILGEGDARLLKKARTLHEKYTTSLFRNQESGKGQPLSPLVPALPGHADSHFKRMFSELYTARDIAGSLLSFDASASCKDVRKALNMHKQDVASIRTHGEIQGYIRLSELGGGNCIDVLRHFATNQVVTGNDTLVDVVHVLTRHEKCFVEMLGQISGVIRRDDMNRPMARMWLFGIITLVEMSLMQLINEYFPDDSWQRHISEGRLEKAIQLQQERLRRNQEAALVDCLQLSDKGLVLIEHPAVLEKLGFSSKRSAKKVVSELEALRNHLAHAQDIATDHWAQIARLAQRVEELTGENH